MNIGRTLRVGLGWDFLEKEGGGDKGKAGWAEYGCGFGGFKKGELDLTLQTLPWIVKNCYEQGLKETWFADRGEELLSDC